MAACLDDIRYALRAVSNKPVSPPRVHCQHRVAWRTTCPRHRTSHHICHAKYAYPLAAQSYTRSVWPHGAPPVFVRWLLPRTVNHRRCRVIYPLILSPPSFPIGLPLSWLGFGGRPTKQIPSSSEEAPWSADLEHAVLGPFFSKDGSGGYGETAFFHKVGGFTLRRFGIGWLVLLTRGLGQPGAAAVGVLVDGCILCRCPVVRVSARGRIEMSFTAVAASRGSALEVLRRGAIRARRALPF